MKELFRERCKLNQEIGYRQGEIKILIEKYGEEIAKSSIECIKKEIERRQKKIDILEQAEEILLGIWKEDK